MNRPDPAWLDAQYNNRARVPEAPQILERWANASALARAQSDCVLDIPYGSAPGETLDVFRAARADAPVFVFIHGGYWRALDKSQHSFVAEPFVNAGVTVAMINYALCPNVTIEDLVRQVVQAAAWLYRNGNNFGAPAGPLYVAGHSAGGHLTAMTLCAQWPRYAPDLPAKVVKGGLAVSGLFDVEPVMNTPSVNVDVRLTPASARRVSPALMQPATDAPLYLAVGGKEQDGFHEQHALIKRAWKTRVAGEFACPEDNHFTILNRLADPGSALFNGALKMMGVAA